MGWLVGWLVGCFGLFWIVVFVVLLVFLFGRDCRDRPASFFGVAVACYSLYSYSLLPQGDLRRAPHLPLFGLEGSETILAQHQEMESPTLRDSKLGFRLYFWQYKFCFDWGASVLCSKQVFRMVFESQPSKDFGEDGPIHERPQSTLRTNENTKVTRTYFRT